MKTPVPVRVSQAQSARTGIDTTGLPGQSSRPAVMPFAMGAGLQRGGGDGQPVASQVTHGAGGGQSVTSQATRVGQQFGGFGGLGGGGLFDQARGGQSVTSQATRQGQLFEGLGGGGLFDQAGGGQSVTSLATSGGRGVGGGGGGGGGGGVGGGGLQSTLYSIKELTCQAGKCA